MAIVKKVNHRDFNLMCSLKSLLDDLGLRNTVIVCEEDLDNVLND